MVEHDYAVCPESEDGKHAPIPAFMHDTGMAEGYFTVECRECHQTTGFPMPRADEITWD